MNTSGLAPRLRVGPRSAKGDAFAGHDARRGLALDRLDLRVPSLERLRPSAMIAVVHQAAGTPRARRVELADGHGLLASLPRLLDESDRFLAPRLAG